MASGDPIPIEVVATPEAIMDARRRIADLYMDDRVMDYIVDIVHATREPAAAGLAEPCTPLIEFAGPVREPRSRWRRRRGPTHSCVAGRSSLPMT